MNKVLLVEDEAIELRMLDCILSKKYDVVCATNGVDALNILKKSEDFSLIISDINMDKMDGIEFKKQINNDSHLIKIPFMFLSHIINPEVEKECLELGADFFFHKPFVKFDLLMEVEKILESKYSVL